MQGYEPETYGQRIAEIYDERIAVAFGPFSPRSASTTAGRKVGCTLLTTSFTSIVASPS